MKNCVVLLLVSKPTRSFQSLVWLLRGLSVGDPLTLSTAFLFIFIKCLILHLPKSHFSMEEGPGFRRRSKNKITERNNENADIASILSL